MNKTIRDRVIYCIESLKCLNRNDSEYLADRILTIVKDGMSEKKKLPSMTADYGLWRYNQAITDVIAKLEEK